MAKKKRIPKNRDIEEMQQIIEQGDLEKINTMQDVIDLIDRPKQELKAKKQAMRKRLQNVYERKDAQVADRKTTEKYQKVVANLQKEER